MYISLRKSGNLKRLEETVLFFHQFAKTFEIILALSKFLNKVMEFNILLEINLVLVMLSDKKDLEVNNLLASI